MADLTANNEVKKIEDRITQLKTQSQMRLKQEIDKLKARQQTILARQKLRERKDRTRRLIQIGAVVEKYLQVHTPEQAELLGQFIINDKDLLQKVTRYIVASPQKTEN